MPVTQMAVFLIIAPCSFSHHSGCFALFVYCKSTQLTPHQSVAVLLTRSMPLRVCFVPVPGLLLAACAVAGGPFCSRQFVIAAA